MQLKFKFLVLVCFFLYGTVNAQNAKFEWGHVSQSSSAIDQGWAITLDNIGMLYHGGTFEQSLDVDPGVGVSSITSMGDDDCFIRKVDENENLIWAKSFGGSFDDAILDMTCDSAGNVICAGYFRDSVDFDPGPNEFNLITQNKAYFVLKLDGNGDFIWAFSIEYYSNVARISLESDGVNNIFLGGGFIDSIDLDPSVLEDIYYPASVAAGYISKYSESGNYMWGKVLEGSNSGIRDLVIDTGGNTIGVGSYSGTVDFDPSLAISNESALGSSESFVWKLDEFGNYVWSRFFKGGVSNNTALDVETNNGDDVLVSGTFSGIVDFDPGSPVNNQSSNTDNGGISYDRNPYLVKLSPSGNLVWVDIFLGGGTASVDNMTVDNNGDIYLIGEHNELYDFDPSATGVYTLYDTGSGNDDIFIVKIADNSNFVWAKQLGGDFYSMNDIEVDTANGFVYCSGTLNNLVDLNPGYGIYNVSTALVDYFLLKLQPCIPSYYTDSVAACSVSSYQWINGKTYTSNNNTDHYILEAANGCDSIIRLNLTFGTPNSGTDQISACESYTWINGVTYTSSNFSATHIVPNTAGCDSTVSLSLTIYPSNTTTDVVQACGQYTWIDGNTYTSNNNSAQYLLTNGNGCDSLVQLDLIFGAPNSGTDLVSACDAYTWIDGNTYTSNNNSATYVLPNSYGCDSTVSLNLAINSSNSGTDIISECESYTWIDGNTYTSNNNSATHILTNAQGCDSTVTLDLIILNPTIGTEMVTTCNDFSWIDGNTYTSSTSATYTISGGASNGCDSIVTLNLTIDPLNTTITNDDPELIAPSGFSAYQWLDCNNGFTPISGETTSTFLATQNGLYAVQVEENGCLDTSACVAINQVSLVELSGTNWTVYPNPTTDKVTLNFQENMEEISVEITNPLGQIIRNQSFKNTAEIELTLGSETGLYFVQVMVDGKQLILRVLKL